jgi:hypothetical protein
MAGWVAAVPFVVVGVVLVFALLRAPRTDIIWIIAFLRRVPGEYALMRRIDESVATPVSAKHQRHRDPNAPDQYGRGGGIDLTTTAAKQVVTPGQFDLPTTTRPPGHRQHGRMVTRPRLPRATG